MSPIGVTAYTYFSTIEDCRLWYGKPTLSGKVDSANHSDLARLPARKKHSRNCNRFTYQFLMMNILVHLDIHVARCFWRVKSWRSYYSVIKYAAEVGKIFRNEIATNCLEIQNYVKVNNVHLYQIETKMLFSMIIMGWDSWLVITQSILFHRVTDVCPIT